MKKIPLLLLFVAALQFGSYAQGTLLDSISSIKLAEVDEPRTVVVKGLYFRGPNPPGSLNYPLTKLSVNKSESEIVITDTMGLSPSNTQAEIEPSKSGLDVIVDLNIRSGFYYCQNTTNGRTKTERGQLGVHRPLASMSPLQTFSGSDHFATAAANRRIIIYRYTSTGAVVEVARFSTTGQTIYVYRNNGDLIVAQ